MSYRAKAPRFYILPSQFPNDWLSPTNLKASTHTATVIPQGILTPFPFHQPLPYRVVDTLCEYIKFYSYILRITPTLLQGFYQPYFMAFFRIFHITIITEYPLKKESINFCSTILVRT